MFYLENCKTFPAYELSKNEPNRIIKLKLFDAFPKNAPPRCAAHFPAIITEVYSAWLKGRLTGSLRKYRILATLEDINTAQPCPSMYSLVSHSHNRR